MGGTSMVGLSAEHRAGAGVAGGDEVEVDLELDSAPREVTVPADLAAETGSAAISRSVEVLKQGRAREETAGLRSTGVVGTKVSAPRIRGRSRVEGTR
jgi:hypothetical protein